MAAVVACPECSAKNRLQGDAAPSLAPRCGKCRSPLPWIVEATDATFDRDTSAPVPVLVDLWAPWCAPCRVLAPILDELARERAGQLKIVKVNVDENPGVATRFAARGVPTLVVMRDGQVRETVVGVRPKAALRQLLDTHG